MFFKWLNVKEAFTEILNGSGDIGQSDNGFEANFESELEKSDTDNHNSKVEQWSSDNWQKRARGQVIDYI